MKKLFVFSVASFLIATGINAQTSEAAVKKNIASLNRKEATIEKEKRKEKKELRKLEGKEASFQAKQAFIREFGNIPVSQWRRTANFDEATFSKNGKPTTAFFDADATLVGTTSHKTFADIPANAQKYINKKYHGYTKSDVMLFDDNELNKTDMILYGNQFDDADNYFVELKKDNKAIVLQVNMNGDVSFFKQLK